MESGGKPSSRETSGLPLSPYSSRSDRSSPQKARNPWRAASHRQDSLYYQATGESSEHRTRFPGRFGAPRNSGNLSQKKHPEGKRVGPE